jgi:hypothetical protein
MRSNGILKSRSIARGYQTSMLYVSMLGLELVYMLGLELAYMLYAI